MFWERSVATNCQIDKPVALEKFQMQIFTRRERLSDLYKHQTRSIKCNQLWGFFGAGRRWKKWVKHFVEVWMWVKHRPKNAQNPSLELGEFLKFGDAKALQWAVPASNECCIFPWANLSTVLSWKKSISYIPSMFISGDGQQERWTWRTNEGLEVYQSRNAKINKQWIKRCPSTSTSHEFDWKKTVDVSPESLDKSGIPHHQFTTTICSLVLSLGISRGTAERLR